MRKLGKPSLIVIVLSAVLAGLQVLQEIVLKGNPQIQGVIAVLLTFIGAVVVTPLAGPAFRNALHLPAIVGLILGAVFASLSGALQIVGLSYPLHVVLISVVTFLATLGFGATGATPLPVVPKTAT